MIREEKIEEVIKEITEDIRSRTDIATIGLSGGADSTLVSILCTLALGKENVYGYGMPYNDFDKETFNSRSEKLAKKLNVQYKELSIQDPVKHIEDEFMQYGTGTSELNAGNLRARMRMIYLYTANQQITELRKARCRVIGTGNKSEDSIGYQTKFGDSAADCFPIGQLFKSEVYQLLEYFTDKRIITEDMVDRIPSAGLWKDQTDEEEIGYSYDEMEPAVRFCEENEEHMEDITLKPLEEFVWNKIKTGKHKMEPAPVTPINKENFTY